MGWMIASQACAAHEYMQEVQGGAKWVEAEHLKSEGKVGGNGALCMGWVPGNVVSSTSSSYTDMTHHVGAFAHGLAQQNIINVYELTWLPPT